MENDIVPCLKVLGKHHTVPVVPRIAPQRVTGIEVASQNELTHPSSQLLEIVFQANGGTIRELALQWIVGCNDFDWPSRCKQFYSDRLDGAQSIIRQRTALESLANGNGYATTMLYTRAIQSEDGVLRQVETYGRLQMSFRNKCDVDSVGF